MTDFAISLRQMGAGPAGKSGDDGWTPILATVADGERCVQQVTGWTGGQGVAPISGWFIGTSGYVETIEEAADIRGSKGDPGSAVAVGSLTNDLLAPLPARTMLGNASGVDMQPAYLSPSEVRALVLENGTISNPILAKMQAGQIKGLPIGVQDGPPQDLSRDQVLDVLGFSLQDLIPAGSVLDWPFLTAPDGYLLLSGQLLSRTIYHRLWSTVETRSRIVSETEWTAGAWGTFSSGDGTTTFRLPDPRGVFIRALDGGRGTDAGRLLGSSQQDAVQRIQGGLYFGGGYGFDAITNSWGAFVPGNKINYRANTLVSDHGGSDYTAFDSAEVTRSAAETRPVNIAWNKIIRI